MKVLVVNNRFFVSGGPESYMFRTMDGLQERGIECIPFSTKSVRNAPSVWSDRFADPIGGEDKVYYDDLKGDLKAKLVAVGRQFYSFHVRSRLRRLIREAKPDIVYVLMHFNKLSPSVIDACRDEGVPVVVRLSEYFLACPQAHFLSNGVHCMDCLDSGLSSCVKRRCVRGSLPASAIKAAATWLHRSVLRTYSNVDAFVCTNGFMETVLARTPHSRRRIQTIPTFYSGPLVELPPLTVSDPPYFIYVGRIAKEKGVDTLVKVYERSGLADRVGLKIVGGSLEQFLKVHPDMAGREILSRIEFVEFAPPEQVIAHLRGALAFAFFPRWVENLPNTLIESVFAGVPVLSFDFGSIPYAMAHGRSAILTPYDDLDAAAASLRGIYEDPALRARISECQREERERFRKDHHLDYLVGLFDSIVSSHQGKSVSRKANP
jgi:glycosyltransferase involved in cell wall biosynthesis